MTAIEGLEDWSTRRRPRLRQHEERGGAGTQGRLFHLKRAMMRLAGSRMPLRRGWTWSRTAVVREPALTDIFNVERPFAAGLRLADDIRDVLTSLLEVRVAQAANRLNR